MLGVLLFLLIFFVILPLAPIIVFETINFLTKERK